MRYQDSLDDEMVVLGKNMKILEEKLYEYENYSSEKYSFIAGKEDTFSCCKPADIEKKCVAINYYENKLCVFPIVNICETD